MARKKAEPSAPPRVDTRRGCVDCAHYPEPLNKQPCKGCKDWSAWVMSDKCKEKLERWRQIEEEIAGHNKKKGKRKNERG